MIIHETRPNLSRSGIWIRTTHAVAKVDRQVGERLAALSSAVGTPTVTVK